MNATDRPLAGRRVLLTRPAGRSAALARRLEELGATVDARPTIRLERAADPEPARRAVRDLERYDWIVFTSPGGVRFFLAVLHDVRGRAACVPGRIAAIGPATARAVISCGLSPSIVAADSRSEGLAQALDEAVAGGQRVLIVKPEVTRPMLVESLRRAGALVDPVVFYRNLPAPGVEQLAREVSAGAFDAVVFTAPSSFLRLLEAAPRADELLSALGRSQAVAIGQVTASALGRAGARVAAVAREPTEDGLVRAVASLSWA